MPVKAWYALGMGTRLRDWARGVRQELYALVLAGRDRRVPWYVRGLVLATVAYAASPVDLIPDFVPVVGLLDDLVIVPLAIVLIVKLMPAEVLAEARAKAAAVEEARRRGEVKRHPLRWVGLGVMVGLWVSVLALVAWGVWRWW